MRPIDPSDLPPLRTFVVRRFKDADHSKVEDVVIEAHSIQVYEGILTAATGCIIHDPHTGKTEIVAQACWIFNANIWLDVQEIVMKPSSILH